MTHLGIEYPISFYSQFIIEGIKDNDTIIHKDAFNKMDS